MQAEIRLAQSGHSYHYSELSSVYAMMQQIRKDFKIQMEDQKIIIKSGQILKSTMSFQSIHELMKKTMPTNNSTTINPMNSNPNQIRQIQCLYIYNQKELLRPIEQKSFSDESFLRILKQKCNQMSSLAQNSYEFRQFTQKVSQKNINLIIETINQKLKSPLESIIPRYNRLLNNLNERNYTKLQISALLDLIQNQDKARKLLIRNVQYMFDRKTKKRFTSLIQKITKQVQKQNQNVLKQNSNFFSSRKPSKCSERLMEIGKALKQIQQACQKFYDKLKQEKKHIIKQKFMAQQKVTYRIDRKASQIEKEYDENFKFVKQYYEDFCEELIRINASHSKNKQKQGKDAFKNLLLISDKILAFQKKIQQNIKEFTQMYLQLSKIHTKGQAQNIKVVFKIYIQLIRAYQQLDSDVKKLQKQFVCYKEQKSSQIKVPETNESKNSNMPLKKSVCSPNKQQKEKEGSSISKQSQYNVPKMSSPIKSKICKNNMRILNEQISQKNFDRAIKQNKQLARRLSFNRRLEGLAKYCSNLCQKQQQLRRSFRNSKGFQENKIDLLGKLNVPTLQIDYNQTSDVQLFHLYKKWIKQSSLKTQVQINWQAQLVETSNSVTKTLTAYLASKSNTTERQRNLEKILCLLSQTFYRMMKAKLQDEAIKIEKRVKQETESSYRESLESLRRENEQMSQKMLRMGQSLQSQNQTKDQSSMRELNSCKSVQKLEQIQKKYRELGIVNQEVEDQNINLKGQIKSMQQKLLNYQEQMDQITQRLISSYEQSNAEQVQRLHELIRAEKQLSQTSNNSAKQSKAELQKANKNLVRQVQTSQTLYTQIQELSAQKDFYQNQFSQLKNILADREVCIIKLEKLVEAFNQSSRLFQANDHSSGINHKQPHTCQSQQQITGLRQDKEMLQQQLEQLEKQLKDILFKQTEEQQVQTEQVLNSTDKDKYNMQANNNMLIQSSQQTHKLLQNKFINGCNEGLTKQIVSHNRSDNCYSQNIVSRYYVQSNTQQQHWSTALSKSVQIGKTVEQGMCHIFLPFSNGIYVGVTVNEDQKNYTNYQQYLTQSQTLTSTNQPVYILDMKEFNLRTNEMLRQCSLVLVVRVEKKEQFSMGKKIMVTGKIEHALGFQDDDMYIKNYSSFLEE